jgi:hypothetical protein
MSLLVYYVVTLCVLTRTDHLDSILLCLFVQGNFSLCLLPDPTLLYDSLYGAFLLARTISPFLESGCYFSLGYASSWLHTELRGWQPHATAKCLQRTIPPSSRWTVFFFNGHDANNFCTQLLLEKCKRSVHNTRESVRCSDKAVISTSKIPWQ